ncbi:MAG: ABC transporter ATP-binding protein [Oscillospiraceae bacterium]
MRRVLREFFHFKWWVLGSVFGTMLGAMSDLLLPMLLSDIINIGVGNQDYGHVVRDGVLMLLVTVGAVAGAVFGAYCSSRAATGFARNLRRDVFAKVQTFTQAEMSRFGPASLITRNTNDVNQMQGFVLMFTRILVRSPIMLIGGSIMAYSKSSQLAKPLLFAIPAIVLIIFIASRVAMPLFRVMQKKVDAVNRVLREQITGIRVIRAFVNEDHEEKRFDGVSGDLADTGIKMMRTVSVLMPLLMLTMNFTVVAILWSGAVQVSTAGGLLAGDLLAVIQYVMQIMFSLVMLAMIFMVYPRAQASAERIAEVLEAVPAIQDPTAPKTLPERGSVTLEFRDVTFRFPGAERPTLENISFSAGKGETTAIIGSTGSGKTTLLNLIVRFFDVSEGAVLVDGVDVRELSQHDLRSRIGYVPQRAQMFSGTIADNLRYGEEDADIREMSAAAETAQALDFIEEKDGQFDAHVAQGGTNFSGGQKQRLSIARALVRDAEIYLFDDSFSALDAATDLKLRRALAEKTENATVVIVAQRISTIRDADRILVLDDGRMAGIGTHSELMKSCEVYREIAYSQFSEKEVAG